jgi:hypothetical protein
LVLESLRRRANQHRQLEKANSCGPQDFRTRSRTKAATTSTSAADAAECNDGLKRAVLTEEQIQFMNGVYNGLGSNEVGRRLCTVWDQETLQQLYTYLQRQLDR